MSSERLRGIEDFVAAVESGSFAQAAQRLRRTRSAVAKSVTRLEVRLGTRLFHRTTRSQSLTEDGQAYYERCRRALTELEAAESVLEAGRREPVGTLRLSMPELFGRACVAPLLMRLASEHPGLGLDLHFSDRNVDLVEDGFDLAVRSGPLVDSTTLAARLLGTQWMGLYASPEYIARHAPMPSDWPSLVAAAREHHAFAVYAHAGWPQPWRYRDDGTGEERDFEVPARLRCGSLEVVAMAAEAGLGIARLPVWLASPSVAKGRLVRLFDEARPFGYDLHAVWPQARALPRKTRVVIDALASEVGAVLAQR